MLPLTIVQFQALFGFGERPFRADYLVFIWSAVPWWWRLRHPFAFLHRAAWVAAFRVQRDRAARWGRAIRTEPGPTVRLALTRLRAEARVFLGLDQPPRRGRRGSSAGAATHAVSEIGD